MATIYHLVSRDAQQALTEFSNAFDAAFVAAESDPWASQLGMASTSPALKTTWPIPISAAGYKERKGDDKLRSLYERSMSMTIKEWVDGVAEKAAIVEAPDFLGWQREPQNMALEARRLPQTLVAELVLEANPLLDFYRFEAPGGSVASTIRLFAANHPVNVLDSRMGTFDNDLDATAGIGTALVQAVKLHFRNLKAPNGKPMKLKLSDWMVPASREDETLDFFQRDYIVQAIQNVAANENVAAVMVQNRHKGTVRVVVADELTSDSYGYAIANGGQIPAWVVQTGSGSPEEIRYDKNDALYKDTGKIGVKYVLKMGVAGCLPHGIARLNYA